MEYVRILGCGSALPVGNRFPSAQVIKSNEKFFLIDCGEGTQLRLREAKIPFNRISHIFITHLHGDHFFGLPGLLSSLHLLGRTKPLKLFGPKGLMEILNLQFKLSGTILKYPLEYTEVGGKEKILLWENKSIEVHSFPLNHRIRCHGYFFQEKRKPNRLIVSKIQEYNIPEYLRNNIKNGADFETKEGQIIPNEELTFPSDDPVSFAYCSDNRIKNKLASYLKGVDFIYHEATFRQKELDRAIKTYHSTAEEAAKLAKQLGVKKLIIGHYSARYQELDELLEEATNVFPDTVLGEEGLVFPFNGK